jgi:hypothetical protein
MTKWLVVQAKLIHNIYIRKSLLNSKNKRDVMYMKGETWEDLILYTEPGVTNTMIKF